MTDPRPAAAELRELVIDDLGGTFAVLGVDESGFDLGSRGKAVRVEISAGRLDVHLTAIEDSAFDAMGIEPRWRSSLSLVAVHVLEEVAMAEPGQRVVVDGLVIRRDPPA